MSATRLIGDRAFIANGEAIERRYLGGVASSLAGKRSARTRLRKSPLQVHKPAAAHEDGADPQGAGGERRTSRALARREAARDRPRRIDDASCSGFGKS